jgi:hypothetical protein
MNQLLIYRFGGSGQFEGQLLGALERLEAGGSLRVLDTLFVGKDATTGELAAIELRRVGAGGIVAPLVSFRLDAAERRRATERALTGSSAGLIGSLAGTLEPGEAVAAVLVAHVWADVLDEAVARMGGAPQASELVSAATLAELAPAVVAASEPAP